LLAGEVGLELPQEIMKQVVVVQEAIELLLVLRAVEALLNRHFRCKLLPSTQLLLALVVLEASLLPLTVLTLYFQLLPQQVAVLVVLVAAKVLMEEVAAVRVVFLHRLRVLELRIKDMAAVLVFHLV